MARISGIDLPRNKRMEVALTYIYGIGVSLSNKILSQASIDKNKKSDELTEKEVSQIREVIEKNYTVEGDLRRRVSLDIKRLIDLGTYRGSRHRKGLPVRGQNTQSNARTRKGPRKTVAGKKSVKAMKG
ncbi:MAG: 30S ribosomal protein S13 [Deltaproteobacteria bacterium]|nr:30S ribosomal protein S13 [Deltaproteobacteria bacterium]